MILNQLQKNLLLNIFALVTNVIVGIFYTPYLVESLGIIAYGVVPLTLIINQYISVLTGSLSGALTRFYSVALQQKDYKKASKCLSTVVGTFFIVIAFLLPFVVVFICNLEHLFDIPQIVLKSAKLLFLFTIFSFFVSLFSTSLNVTLYAENRLDLMNWIKIIRTSFKFLFAISFFELVDKDVFFIGISNFLSEIIVLCVSYWLFKVSKDKLVRVTWSLFDKTLLVSISGMTLWTIIHQMGDVGIYRIDNILVNNSFGMKYSGTLGAISEFGVYVSLVVSVIGSLYGPMILKHYAKGEHGKVQEMVLNNSLIVGSLSAILCGVLMGVASVLLSCWLGASFSEYGNWLILKLLPLPFYGAAGIYAFSNRAWNEIRYPAIITVVMGGFNFLALYLISNYVRIAQTSIIEIISLMLLFASFVVVCQSFILNSKFFLKVYPINKKEVIAIFLKIWTVLIISFLLSKAIVFYYVPTGLFELLIMITAVVFPLLLLVYVLIFNEKQKKAFLSLIKN